MNKRTLAIRYAELLRDIRKHPHKDELLNIMYQQVQDDVDTPSRLSRTTYSQEILCS